MASKIIEEQWDQILRFIATIKLKETTASQLFRRLSSYSKQHPLYRALKAFGQIIKTIFLLKYIDDVTLRQVIEKQLNTLEEKRPELYEQISKSSIVYWQHINLLGEFDFSDEKLKNAVQFHLTKILELKVV